jgi:hypothetical protein
MTNNGLYFARDRLCIGRDEADDELIWQIQLRNHVLCCFQAHIHFSFPSKYCKIPFISYSLANFYTRIERTFLMLNTDSALVVYKQ